MDTNRYELSNQNATQLPLMIGFSILRYKTIITFDSANSFTLERYANKLPYFKISYHNKIYHIPLKGNTASLEDLNYQDNFVSPDNSM